MPWPPKPVELTALTKTPTSFRLQINGAPGQQFEIQATHDFITWEPADTLHLINSEPLLINDMAAVNQPRRFYRAVQIE